MLSLSLSKTLPFLIRCLGPADAITTNGVCVIDLLRLPGVVCVRVGKHRDGSVTGPTHQDQPQLMRGPRNTKTEQY